MLNRIYTFLSKPLFRDKRFVCFLWLFIALIAGFKHVFRGVSNDYLIYKSVFYHTIEQVNLYLYYPELNGDCNHYGPIFSLVFAPFALMPDSIGTVFWELAMALVLYVAIYKLPVQWNYKVVIYFISLQGLFANAVNSETNTLITALIIGAFICIRKENDFWAACFIALGLFIKLYTIVGFAFFFFSKHKMKLISYFLLWSSVFFVLPMFISSPEFIIQTYSDWYESLLYKNGLNIESVNQNISVMGLIGRISGYRDLNNLFIIIPAIFLFALQYIRVYNYDNLKYQLGILASTLMFIILFSTGSEPCSYIIATVGFGIWFITQPKPYSKSVLALLVFVLVMILMSSGVLPNSIRGRIIKGYALEAIPFLIVWLVLVCQLVSGKIGHTFNKNKLYE